MNYYGDAVLGVECALPRNIDMVRRPGHAVQFVNGLLAVLTRRT